MYALIFLGNLFMGEGCILQWFSITNTIMAFGPTSLWLRRGSREGLSAVFAIATVVGTLFTFAPFGQYVLVMPELFANPAFYVTGVILEAVSLFNLGVVLSYPRKKDKTL